ncbi:Asp-tRNA(Asn)/Glu-tRNA(Gln) amidotransferase subunit GatB [Candidatus Parcubacteria bacterium]|nr:Asp-tRNA(Asn)/Glu-tRNA(Gln) amidotransferase subunit GatB [Candidatus Parcubacteria bacterium]
MTEYVPTIGLEIHAELRTKTKMFCNSKNDTDEARPNVNICPVCLGYPGTLPVINREAVKHVLRFGVSVGGTLADYTEFDRKNYFYPDIPKGYQISQYKFPLVAGGELKGVKLTRVHLEEDTAKSSHEVLEHSLVDFNRAGVPLMELVTEPVMHSAEEAANFARELQLLLVYLGASTANMEKGEMRVEANISVSKDIDTLGTKVEVKNLNSFKAVEKAIRFEIARHAELLERGESVVQETRGWDEHAEKTFSQRAKENSHDYRYFPDPDLPKLFVSEISEFSEGALKNTLPELPWERRDRYVKDLGIKPEDAEIFIRNIELGKYFEETANVLENKTLNQTASNYITSDLKTPIPPEALAEIIRMTSDGTLSSRGAKDILKIIQSDGGDPRTIANEKGLVQKSDMAELEKIVQELILENSAAVGEYKSGKEASLQFLIGQGMKKTKGSANPSVLKEIFIRLLRAG